MVEHMQAGLRSSTNSVQVAAAGALANAADAAAGIADAGLDPTDIPALIAQGEPLHRLQNLIEQMGERHWPNLSKSLCFASQAVDLRQALRLRCLRV